MTAENQQTQLGKALEQLIPTALSPIAWLVVLQLCMVLSLYLVGYLSVPEVAEVPATVLVNSPKGAEYRAGLAYSGVTLGITFVLAITSFAWASSAYLRKGPSFPEQLPQWRRGWILWVAGAVVIGAALLTYWFGPSQPFPSKLGVSLLKWVYAQPGTWVAWLAPCVPAIMFFLSLIVPAILAAGASFLQEPIDDAAPEDRNRKITLRVRELDHLLYIGALALVFGTLQLSATMSVPLASAPKAADLKNQVELCRTFAAAPASSPLYQKASEEKCLQLPGLMEQEQAVAGLRQLVRAVTIALGLAFSAMLVAIYVPAMVSLRLMLSPVAAEPSAQGSDLEKPHAAPPSEIDPLQRLATVAATLGPLIAGIVANAFAGG